MVSKPETVENPFAATNVIQVRIDENVRMLAELHARWEREDEISINNNMTKVCTITTTSNVDASKPPKVPIPFATFPKPNGTFSNKNAKFFLKYGRQYFFYLE